MPLLTEHQLTDIVGMIVDDYGFRLTALTNRGLENGVISVGKSSPKNSTLDWKIVQ